MCKSKRSLYSVSWLDLHRQRIGVIVLLTDDRSLNTDVYAVVAQHTLMLSCSKSLNSCKARPHISENLTGYNTLNKQVISALNRCHGDVGEEYVY